MIIYKNKELTEKVSELDLGIVEAGEKETFIYYVHNETMAEIKNLIFKIDSPEVKIIESPIELAPKAVGELVLEWHPSITLKQGLKTRLSVSGIELWS